MKVAVEVINEVGMIRYKYDEYGYGQHSTRWADKIIRFIKDKNE